MVFRLPGEVNENDMFCVDCAPEDSRSDGGAEPGDALGRLLQSGKKRSERRTEAERAAAAEVARARFDELRAGAGGRDWADSDEDDDAFFGAPPPGLAPPPGRAPGARPKSLFGRRRRAETKTV